jgi:Short C-terminal domain
MPGLLRGVARTAAIAGTASAVSGRVQRHQAEKFAERDAQIIEGHAEAFEQGVTTAAPPAYAPPAPEAPDTLSQLKQLGELHASGVLTDEEFAAQKAKILG